MCLTRASSRGYSREGSFQNTIESMAAWKVDAETRWPLLFALASMVVLHFALPDALTVFPDWVLGLVFLVLAALVLWFHYRRAERRARIAGLTLLSAVTLALVVSLFLLLHSLPEHKVAPVDLLRAAASLWVSNLLAFAAWYWALDGGGAYARAKKHSHVEGAFLFPQMALHEASPAKPEQWHPRFIDYLFLSFNTSTAFSPTDTQVLSRWAKALMMLQSVVSLTIIAVLAARAVNIL